MQQRLSSRESELLAERDKLQSDNRGLQQRLSSRESELLAEVTAVQQRLSSRESELIAERDKLQAEVILLLRAEKDKLQQRLSSPSSTAEMRGSGSARRTDSPIDREARRSARRQAVALVRINHRFLVCLAQSLSLQTGKAYEFFTDRVADICVG